MGLVVAVLTLVTVAAVELEEQSFSSRVSDLATSQDIPRVRLKSVAIVLELINAIHLRVGRR